MRTIVLISVVLAVVSARPDIGLKLRQGEYDYQNQVGGSYSGQTSYNAPSGAVGSNYRTQDGGFSNQYSTGATGFGGSSAGSAGFGAGSAGFGGASSGANRGFSGGSSTGFSGGAGSGGFSNGGGSSSGFSSGSGFSAGGAGGSASRFGGGGSSGATRVVRPIVQYGEPIITKSFYVHAAPEEDESRAAQPITVVRPQKNYKVIFIKAPHQSSSAARIAAQRTQAEEKTIVYVLSKNPSDSENIQLEDLPAKTPTKPEVYFIRYNNKQEATQIVDGIQQEYQRSDNVDTQSIGNSRGAVYTDDQGIAGLEASFSQRTDNTDYSAGGASAYDGSSQYSTGGSSQYSTGGSSTGGSAVQFQGASDFASHGGASHDGSSHGGAAHDGSSHGGASHAGHGSSGVQYDAVQENY